MPAIVALLLVTPASATEPRRVFVRFDGDEETVAALGSAASRFEAALLEGSAFEVAGTAEMEQIYADCAEQIGTNAETRRECQLRAANRLMVEHVIEIGAGETPDGGWELVLTVWNPTTNSKVHAAVVDVEGASLAQAARQGLPLLAAHYLCFQGDSSQCTRASKAATESASATSATVVATPDLPTGVQPSSVCPPGHARVGESCLADADNDALADVADTCPDEPENHDGFEDEDGCPEADTDRDGVRDHHDRCPTYVEDEDDFEDDDGCREEHDNYGLAGWITLGSSVAFVAAGFGLWEYYTEQTVEEYVGDDENNMPIIETHESPEWKYLAITSWTIGGAALIAGTVLLLLPEELPDLELETTRESAVLRWTLHF